MIESIGIEVSSLSHSLEQKYDNLWAQLENNNPTGDSFVRTRNFNALHLIKDLELYNACRTMGDLSSSHSHRHLTEYELELRSYSIRRRNILNYCVAEVIKGNLHFTRELERMEFEHLKQNEIQDVSEEGFIKHSWYASMADKMGKLTTFVMLYAPDTISRYPDPADMADQTWSF